MCSMKAMSSFNKRDKGPYSNLATTNTPSIREATQQGRETETVKTAKKIENKKVVGKADKKDRI